MLYISLFLDCHKTHPVKDTFTICASSVSTRGQAHLRSLGLFPLPDQGGSDFRTQRGITHAD